MTTTTTRRTHDLGVTLELRTVAALALALAVSGAHVAAAQTPTRPSASADSHRLVWNESWPRVRAWEYIAAGAAYAGVVALEISGRPTQANWTGNFLFDFALRDAVGTRDPTALSVWKTIGDVPFFASVPYLALDAFLVAGAIRGNWDVAWQMFAMDLEAFAVTLPLVYVTQYFVHRARPYTRYCGEAGGASFSCEGSGATQSFPSGHAAMVATAAALTCAHHSRLALYGAGAGDSIACATWVSAAVLTGFARIAMDKHYASDVLVGLGIGAIAGYAVPVLLHYAMHSGDDPNDRDSAPRLGVARRSSPPADARIMLMPFATAESLGLGALGRW